MPSRKPSRLPSLPSREAKAFVPSKESDLRKQEAIFQDAAAQKKTAVEEKLAQKSQEQQAESVSVTLTRPEGAPPPDQYMLPATTTEQSAATSQGFFGISPVVLGIAGLLALGGGYFVVRKLRS